MTADDLYRLAAVEIQKTKPVPPTTPTPQQHPGQRQGQGGATTAPVRERPWELAGGFPPRPIARTAASIGEGEGRGEAVEEKCLKELGLLGALVTQRWTAA